MTAYRFRMDTLVGDEVRRIATHQVDGALRALRTADPHEAVHDVRRRTKKVRALLRLVRGGTEPLYQRENVAFRDLARQVAEVRDVTAAVEAFDALAERHPRALGLERYTPIRDGLLERRRTVAADELDEAVARVQTDLTAAGERIADWEVPDDGFDSLAAGLGKTYRRARRRLRNTERTGSLEAYHEWRKRVKYHRHHVRLLQDCWPGPMKARREQLHQLSDLLGDDHDLGGLRALLQSDADAYGGAELCVAFTALLDRVRAHLQFRAGQLGRRCFVEKPEPFVTRIAGYWDAWRRDGQSPELTRQ